MSAFTRYNEAACLMPDGSSGNGLVSRTCFVASATGSYVKVEGCRLPVGDEVETRTCFVPLVQMEAQEQWQWEGGADDVELTFEEQLAKQVAYVDRLARWHDQQRAKLELMRLRQAQVQEQEQEPVPAPAPVPAQEQSQSQQQVSRQSDQSDEDASPSTRRRNRALRCYNKLPVGTKLINWQKVTTGGYDKRVAIKAADDNGIRRCIYNGATILLSAWTKGHIADLIATKKTSRKCDNDEPLLTIRYDLRDGKGDGRALTDK